MLLMVVSVTSAVIGESSPYISFSQVVLATPVRFRLRFRSGAAIESFSRPIRSSGNAGLEDVEPDLEALVHVAHVNRHRRRGYAAGQELHPLVDLVGGHRRRPAGPHHGSADGLDAELVLRLEERARAAAAAAAALRVGHRPAVHPAPPAAAAAATGHRRQQRRLEPGDFVVLGDVDDEAVRQRRPEIRRLRRLEVERGKLPEELLGPRALGRRRRRRRHRRLRGRRLGLGRLPVRRVQATISSGAMMRRPGFVYAWSYPFLDAPGAAISRAPSRR